jgi:ATP-binding cassette subfamily G (WHITE) protein 2
MGIGHVRDVIIGDTRKKGISGGERKRVCVAIELLSRPKLLFLDEPTSGLDSTTAYSVCAALKNLSDLGVCTVICTIHQPQIKIFNLFDNLILMKRGEIVYQGSCQKSLLFLETAGLPCPPGVNPADHLLDAINPKAETDNAFDDNAKKVVPVDLSLGMDKTFYTSNGIAFDSWVSQFIILSKRSFQQYYRRQDIILMNFAITVIIAFFISYGIWRDIGTTQSSVASRVPSLFFASVTQGIVASLQCISSFPKERAIMLRERAAGAYFVSSYFAAKTVADIVTQSWCPFIFCAIVYPSIGYQSDANKFFIYLMFMLLDSIAALSLATLGKSMPQSLSQNSLLILQV